MKNDKIMKVLLFVFILVCLVFVYSVVKKYDSIPANKIDETNTIINGNVIDNNQDVTTSEETDSEDDVNLGDCYSNCAISCKGSTSCVRSCTANCSNNGTTGGNSGNKSCSSSQYKDSSGNCKDCNAGYKCNGTKQTACDGEKEYSKAKATSCSKCGAGEKANKNHDGCEPNCNVSGTLMSGKKIVSVGNIYSWQFNVFGCEGTTSISGPGVNGSFSSTPSKSVTKYGSSKPTSPGWSTTTATNTGKNGSSASVKICVVGEWNRAASLDGKPYNSTLPIGITGADNAASRIRADRCDYDTVDKVYRCYNVHTRAGSCASGPPSSPKYYSFCCVNNTFVGVSTDVVYEKMRTRDNCETYLGPGYTKLDVSEDKCHVVPEVELKVCEGNKLKPSKKTAVAEKCETSVPITVVETKCTDNDETNVSFYKIKCTRKVQTSFDYGDDDNETTATKLYKGEGFKFGIDIATTVTCEGKFEYDSWNKVYKVFHDKVTAVEYGYKKHGDGLIGKVDSYNPKEHKKSIDAYEKYINNYLKPKNEEDARRAFYLWGTYFNPLIDAVNGYNNYEPVKDDTENVTLNMDIKVNGETVNIKNVFEKKSVDSGKYKILSSDTRKKINMKNLTQPMNYTKSNEGNPYIVKMVPKQNYLDRATGVIVTKNPDKTKLLDGGNKVYVDYNTDPGTYPMEIIVGGLANNDSEVKNDKCKVNIGKKDLQYRPIDVSNPFINDSWKKGENWVNSKYDFTQTIHAATWSEGTRNKITLKPEDISAIQASNKNYQADSPYLGLCERFKSTSRDAITNTICSKLK